MKNFKQSAKLLLCGLLLLVGNNTFSQEPSGPLPTPTALSSVLPASPEAEGMAKYVTTPVTLYEGMANVSIPIYTLKSYKLSLPISLNYNYSGFRPTEDATWVGLGWTLSAAGCITRQIKGTLDEDPVPFRYDDYLNLNTIAGKQQTLRDIANGLLDGEPDLYIFNFNGYSGKFIMLKGRAMMLPDQDLKIDYVPGSDSFIITTPDGTIYTFGQQETTFTAKTGEFTLIKPHTSSWFLTRIQSADHTDKIDFSYTLYNYMQPSTQGFGLTIFPPTQDQYGDPTPPHPDVITYSGSTGADVNSYQLTNITTASGNTVSFGTSSRSDVNTQYNGGTYIPPTKLSTINIFNAGGDLPNRIVNLSYIYFGASISNSNPSWNACKLGLRGVQITDATPKIISTYNMEYEKEDVPGYNRDINPLATDRWGYGRGICQGNPTFPNPWPRPANIKQLFGDGAAAACSAGSLHKITYPTGGSAVFTYEPNDVAEIVTTTTPTRIDGGWIPPSQYLLVSFNVPGTVPVSATVHFDRQIDHEVVSTEPIAEIYNPDGSPFYANIPSLLGKTGVSGTDVVTLQPGMHYTLRVHCESTSIISEGFITFTTSATNWVNIPTGGNRIKKIESYDNINQTTPALVKNYIYTDDQGRSTQNMITMPELRLSIVSHYDNFHYPSYPDPGFIQNYSSAYGSSSSSLLDGQFYYSKVTEVNNTPSQTGQTVYEFKSSLTDATGIFLTKQTQLKSIGGNLVPLKITENNYEVITKDGVNGVECTVANVDDQMPMQGVTYPTFCLTNPDPDDPNFIFSTYSELGSYAIRSCYKNLRSTVETNYDENGLNPLKTSIQYKYDNPLYHFPTQKTQQNSKGEQIVTQMKYPMDYNVCPDCSDPGRFEPDFINSKSAAYDTYISYAQQRNSAISNDGAWGNLHPYAPNTSGKEEEFSRVYYSFPCEINYKSTSIATYNALNTAWSDYYLKLDQDYTSNNISSSNKALLFMQKNHIISPVIEQYTSIIKPGGTENLLSAVKTDYKMTKSGNMAVPDVISQTELSTPVLKTTFLNNMAEYYQPKVSFTYDDNVNLVEQNKINDMSISYIWDYKSLYPVAEITNASASNDKSGYTSFETEGNGSFNYDVTKITVDPNNKTPTGNMVYSLGSASSILKDGLNQGINYILSLWTNNPTLVSVNNLSGNTIKSKNGWTCLEWKITNSSSVSITSTIDGTMIDELRLYPENARMKTFTYSIDGKITSSCDNNNDISYFEYDYADRLKIVRDADRNIVKKICYSFVGLPVDCGKDPSPVYENLAITQAFSRNNCGDGFTTVPVLYTVSAGKYTSTTSQADADQQAQDDVAAYGQQNANSNGICTAIVYVNIVANNTTKDSYSALYKSSLAPYTTYTFPILASLQNQNLGSLPAGDYDLIISHTSGDHFSNYISPGCNSGISTDIVPAQFNTITISTSDCNAITISPISEQ